MGIQPLPMLLSLLAAAIPLSEPQPMAEERFQQWLLESDLQQLAVSYTHLTLPTKVYV